MSQKYAVLMIDLKKSRGYERESRNNIQGFISDVIRRLNRLYQGNFARELDFSAGGEVQGLFSNPEAAYLCYRVLSMWLHPIKIRSGIGVGTWDVQLESRGTTWQDGTVYHRARRAIENADSSEGYPVLLLSDSFSDFTINTIIGATASIMENQSVAQNQIMLIAELLFPLCSHHVQPSRSMDFEDMNYILYEKCAIAHMLENNVRPFPLDRLHDDVTALAKNFTLVNCEDVRKTSIFYVIGGKQRGIPTKLAGIIHV